MLFVVVVGVVARVRVVVLVDAAGVRVVVVVGVVIGGVGVGDGSDVSGGDGEKLMISSVIDFSGCSWGWWSGRACNALFSEGDLISTVPTAVFCGNGCSGWGSCCLACCDCGCGCGRCGRAIDLKERSTGLITSAVGLVWGGFAKASFVGLRVGGLLLFLVVVVVVVLAAADNFLDL